MFVNLEQMKFRAVTCALNKGDLTEVRSILTGNADGKGENGATALMEASRLGHVQAVSCLLKAGDDVNAKDGQGQTALMWANSNLLIPGLIQCSSPGSVEKAAALLLKAGADVNAKDTKGMTALMRASRNCDVVLVRRLLSFGADVNDKDEQGQTALIWVTSNLLLNPGSILCPLPGKAEKAAALLLEAGADVNAKDKDGKTALAWTGPRSSEAEADADTKDKDDKASLAWVRPVLGGMWMIDWERCRAEVTRLLLEAGADIDSSAEN